MFLLAVSVHGAVGLRAILREWTPLPGGAVNAICLAVSLVLLALGWRAVYGLYGLGA